MAAALVGMVVVLLGYASMSGSGGSGASAETPNAAVQQPSAQPSNPAPVIVSATGAATTDPGGYYVYGNGNDGSTLPSANPTTGPGYTSAPTPTPSASSGAGTTTVVVGGTSGSPAPSASASPSSSTSAATSALDCVLGSNGLTSVLPTTAESGSILGGVVSGADNSIESLLSGLLGSCGASPSASATPSPSTS